MKDAMDVLDLKMAEMIRDKARQIDPESELANADLETIAKEHADVLHKRGYWSCQPRERA